MKPAEGEAARKARRWLVHADEDLRFAQHGFSVPKSPPYRLVAYHAQQYAEEHLKAYLVFHATDFPYTHNLSHLLDLCKGKAAWVERLRDAEELSPYAISARYPGEEEEVTGEEARRAVDIAARVRETVRRALAEEGLEIPE